MYKTADETKPDFSLSGVWLQKDVDTNYASKVTQMNKEESIYGFIANTKATQITTTDTNTIQKYVDNLPPLFKGGGTIVTEGSVLTDLTNLNRIILKIINNNQYEPIKANITHNTVDKKIEIRVTYTANGISSILDEYGNTMTLTEENGKIQTDTGSTGLAKGTYYFTVIDNKGNKKELSITPNVDSLFKVAYTNGTDNMDNTATYTKSNATISSTETTLLNQIKATDTTKNFNRAIKDSNKTITAIGQQIRTSDDEQMYLYGKYKANSNTTYWWVAEATQTVSAYTVNGYRNITKDTSTGKVKLSNWSSSSAGTMYTFSGTMAYTILSDSTSKSGYYYWNNYSSYNKTMNRTYYKLNSNTTYSRGDFNSNVIALDGTYTIGSSSSVHKDNYWYVRNSLAPKYTLYKYDKDLNLKSKYDIDTKTLTTEPVDISNKGRNKVKLTLNMYSSNYKVYISNDNTNWQEVTGITSGVAKELDVDGWDKLYVKVETNIGVTTNTTRVNNIDIAYYKE